MASLGWKGLKINPTKMIKICPEYGVCRLLRNVGTVTIYQTTRCYIQQYRKCQMQCRRDCGPHKVRENSFSPTKAGWRPKCSALVITAWSLGLWNEAAGRHKNSTNKVTSTYTAGLPNLWLACPKWHSENYPWQTAFTVSQFFISFAPPASLYCEEYVDIRGLEL